MEASEPKLVTVGTLQYRERITVEIIQTGIWFDNAVPIGGVAGYITARRVEREKLVIDR